ncbi:MAG: acyl-CoA synthetase [Myxococcota bacterium]
MYVGDYTGRRALYSPDALAVIDAGVSPALRLTYAQLDARANRLAHWLQAQGVGRRDRVGILAHNGVPHLDVLFACSKLGAIAVPYNWRLHWHEQVEVINETGPKVLFYSEDFQKELVTAKVRIQPVQVYVALEGEGLPGEWRYDAVLESQEPTAIFAQDIEETDVLCLLFTGGTTGLPKGAQITHKQIAWNTLNTIIHDLTHGDVTINVFPLFHTGGLFVYTVPLLILGGTVVLTRKFDPTQILELIEAEKVTVFAGVPTMFQMMTQSPRWKDSQLSSLRFCTSGGAPLPIPLVDQFQSEKGVRFKQGFGMTEWGPGCFALAPEHALEKAGSIGRPNFFVAARVVDEQNQPLPPGEVGELVFKGPSGFSGYFENQKATAAAFDSQGWFHTGDMARCDEGQFFYIVDRKKDMFISGGENVYPAEIEAVLYKHPAVAMCAVVGIPDARWGEVGIATVVLKSGMLATDADLLSWMRDRLARYKVPRAVVIRESLPISGAGKILKRELRDEILVVK